MRRVRGLLHGRRGATTLVVVVFVGVIATVMTVAFFIGRTAYHQAELQTSADAVVNAAALVAQDQGRTVAEQVNLYQPVWQQNVTAPLAAAPPLNMSYDAATHLLTINTTMQMAIEKQVVGVENPGDTDIQASGRTQVHQDDITDVTRNRAKVLLVLDYSGSMDSAYGGGMTRLQALRQVVTDLLGLGVDVLWGLVTYSDNVVTTLPVRKNNENAIRAAISDGSHNMTCTSCGLNQAGALLRAFHDPDCRPQPSCDDKLRHVILVSDGLPNEGGGIPGATAASDRLRMNDKSAIFTIQVQSQGGPMEGVMIRMAGDQGDPDGSDANYYYAANDRAAMQAAFIEILARILCQVQPQTLPTRQPDGTYRICGFLRSMAGDEQPVHDRNGVPNSRALQYDVDNQLIRLPFTPDCEKMLNRTHELVLRYDWPIAVE